jgi:tetratricopeptide (TPR) repeat protein
VLARPTLHRLGAWLGRFSSVVGVAPAPAPVPPPTAAGVGPGTGPPDATPPHEAVGALAPTAPRVPPVPGTASRTGPAPTAPLEAHREPAGTHHEEGLRLAAAHRWNHAQRALERATRAVADGPAAADLASVRAVRRQLRVLQKWPRDVPAHLALGRSYFELGLGEDAEATFRRVLILAPEEPAAPYFLALEYAFRGAWGVAEDHYARARTLAPELPPFADCLGERGPAAVGDAPC